MKTEKTIMIKGIKNEEYPDLYRALEDVMPAYNITKIRVFIIPWGVNAAAVSLFGDYLFVTKKILRILDKDEIKAVIAHEFSHLFNRDSFAGIGLMLLFLTPALYFHNIANTANISSGARGILALIALVFVFYGYRINNWIKIRSETRADIEAAVKIKNYKAMETALLKLHLEFFTRIKRPNHFEKISEIFEYLSEYFYGFTHPSLKDRVESLQLVAEKIINNSEEGKNA